MFRPLVALVLAGVAGAQSVEITLRSGESVFGDLKAQTPQDVLIKRSLWYDHHGLGHMDCRLNRGAILHVQVVSSLAQLYQERLAQMPATYAGRYAFVRWCLDRGLVAQALAQVRQLLADSPADAVAHELAEDTGYVLDHDTWVPQADYARAHQLVIYAGVPMTPQEAGLRRTLAASALAVRQAEEHLPICLAQEQARLIDLRDATIVYEREKRHQAQARDAAEEARRRALTPDQLADEEVKRRFDAEHHLAAVAREDDKPVVDARDALAVAQRHYDDARAETAATRTARERAVALHAQAAQEWELLRRAQTLPAGLPLAPAVDDQASTPASPVPAAAPPAPAK